MSARLMQALDRLRARSSRGVGTKEEREFIMQITTWIRRATVIGAASLAMGATFTEPVQARDIGAVTGLAAAAQMPCLSIAFATITNTCAGAVSVDFPLTIDSAGGKFVTVTASHPTSVTGVRCRATATNAAVTSFSHSGGGAFTNLPAVGGPVGIGLDGAVAPAGGQLVVNCQLAQNGKVNILDWNP
jgi:hypothetical protein